MWTGRFGIPQAANRDSIQIHDRLPREAIIRAAGRYVERRCMFDFRNRREFLFEQLEDRMLLAADVQLQLRPVVAGLSAPVVATHAGDGSGRMFIAEQSGAIRVLQQGTLAPTPFLNLGAGGLNRIVTGGERGLLGLAFHPDFAAAGAPGAGRFYVYYSAPRTLGGNHDSVISEFRVSNDPNRADVASERELLRFSQPFSNHNGGDIHFGPDDGLLYISTGDGGSGGDPLNAAQDLSNLLGNILRIDVLGTNAPNQRYGIPASNPFVNVPNVRPEIYAYGLRNPFRFSFDDGPVPEAADRLFAGDVGQFRWEEVDLITSGGNYGWRIREGAHPFNTTDPNPGGLIDPIAEYPNDNTTDSVIGGYVYRGDDFPALYGRYIFGDLTGRMFLLDETEPGNFQLEDLVVQGGDPSSIIAFGQDEEGELYVLTFDSMLAIETRLTTIHGRVFHDLDRDGVREAGEEYLNDWTVELRDADGELVDVQTTHEVDIDMNEIIDPETERGWYWFNVAPGTYTVREVLQPNWRQTLPAATTEQRALALDQRYDFIVSGGLFENWGGLQEKWLLSAADGVTWFYLTPDGDLWLWEEGTGAPLGSALSGSRVASLDVTFHQTPAQLVDVLPPANEYSVTVADGEQVNDRDFGNVSLSFVEGRVFVDRNGDGQPDGGAASLNGWSVELIDSEGAVISTEITADRDVDGNGSIDPATESGWYRFDDLEAGSYSVAQTAPAGWTRTTPRPAAGRESAFEIDQQLDFYSGGNLWENWGGLGERWLQARQDSDRWYFILPSGQLRLWDEVSGTPAGTPLNGSLVAELDPSIHADPTLLIDVAAREVTITAGTQLANQDFGFTQNIVAGVASQLAPQLFAQSPRSQEDPPSDGRPGPVTWTTSPTHDQRECRRAEDCLFDRTTARDSSRFGLPSLDELFEEDGFPDSLDVGSPGLFNE